MPDETLFSLVSRYHIISGGLKPDRTCKRLFGHHRQGAAHDFPARLDEFALRTDARLGTPEAIARQRTILPFYFPYRSIGDELDAIAASRTGALGSIKGRLGILASGFGAAHPLKACPDCIVEDLAVHKVSYWHRNHQWPACWICHKHGTWLKFALAKVNSSGRFHWFLPSDVVLADGIVRGAPASNDSSIRRLAECSLGLGALPVGFRFEPARLVATYRGNLLSRGLLRAGRVDSVGLGQTLLSVCKPLAAVEGFRVLSGDELDLSSQFTRLVRAHRGAAHPVRHLVLVAALFEDWSSFLTSYLKGAEVFTAPGTSCTPEIGRQAPDKTREAKRSALVSAVHAGVSPSAAASTYGVSVATAMSWLAQVGDSITRRPKKLTPELRERAINRLRRGASKQSIAEMAGVSIQSVTLLLRTEPGLQQEWHDAVFARRQRNARRSWTRSAARLSLATPNALRQLQPAVFAWLYRNDRAWLLDFATGLGTAPRSNNPSVRWDERDFHLAREIRSTALDLASRDPKRAVKLSMLCDEIRELKSRLSNLDRLPLTRAAIASVVGVKLVSQ